MGTQDLTQFSCPVEATVHLIGGKYKAVILWHLKDQVLRYNELHRLVPKATPKMLTQQLRELERDNLVTRTVYPVVPPKTEYSLTEFGKSMIPILDAMCNWGTSYLHMNSSNTTCCKTSTIKAPAVETASITAPAVEVPAASPSDVTPSDANASTTGSPLT